MTPISIYVHLARGYGAAYWQAKWERGEIIGINENQPYGFFWARENGCIVKYSEDYDEGPLGACVRLGFRFLLGFDLVHAWRNRRGIYSAKVIWTGTESQSLAVLFLLRWRRSKTRPLVIAQIIWLLDVWPLLSVTKRWLYRMLLANASIITLHSEEGLKDAHTHFPGQRVIWMPFGIKVDDMVLPRQRVASCPIRVLSVGSDRHRDWKTLVAAVRDSSKFTVRLVTRQLPFEISMSSSMSQIRPRNNKEYFDLYDWADIVVVPLMPNLHGSGITVIQEATVLGVPVVVTDVGGLRSYFSDQQVRYVPASSPDMLRQAIVEVADDVSSARMVERAQQRMIEAGLTTRGFAWRHAKLSQELLQISQAPA